MIEQEKSMAMYAALKNMATRSEIVSQNISTRKMKGTNFQIPVGYSKEARRPTRDILRWMDEVEELLQMIVEVLEDAV